MMQIFSNEGIYNRAHFRRCKPSLQNCPKAIAKKTHTPGGYMDVGWGER